MRLAAWIFLCLPLAAQTEAAKAEDPLRVLFLGNSYTHTNSLPEMVMAIANSTPGRQIDAKSVTRGGANLAELWSLTNGLETLRSGNWDIVVLQDFSTLGQNFTDSKWNVNDPAGLLKWSKYWHTEIQRKNAKTMLYLTWARKAFPEFQTGLNFAYAEAAKELGAQIAPAGLAWKRIRETQPQLELFTADGSHPSPLGTFLTACVFIESLVGKSCDVPAKAPLVLKLSPETQKLMAEAAHWAMGEYKAGALTNLAKPDYGTLRPLPTAADTKPESFDGQWKGKALIYNTPHDMELKLSVQGRTCKGSVTLSHKESQMKLTYPLNNCMVDMVTLVFLVQDPRIMVEEFRAVVDGDKMLGTHVLRSTDPYKRIQGSFELKKD
jgi:hypothetical protein